MKKALLFACTLLIITSTACGPQDPRNLESSADLINAQTDRAGLTVQNCTPLTVSSVTANGNDGNVPANTQDDRLDTRWSQLGKGAWIDYDLGTSRTISAAAIAWHAGNQRVSNFTLSVSTDGTTYTQVYSGKSSGTTTAAETYAFTALTGRRLRITVNGNTLNDWASIAEARVCAPPAANSGIVWRGDFETGDISQWTRAQMVSSDRLQIVPDPVRQGRYAMKTTVKYGDDPIDSSGNRNELVKMTREPVGSEYYYKFSAMFAPDYPSANTWQLIVQWHHDGNDGSPPVEFVVHGEELRLHMQGNPGTTVWRTPLVRGAWQDFVFHVKWSPDPKVGFVELYHQGQLVLPKRYIATQYSGMLNYLKLGLYRNDTITKTGVVYHDGFTMAKNLSDVLP